jgi:hypothetical protein
MTGRHSRIAFLALLIVTSLAVVLPGGRSSAQSEAMYFPETGYWIDPTFARFWSERGGVDVFGYPISRVFYQDGLHRQYFERAVFEHHEQNPEPYNVLLMRLGAHTTIERRKHEEPFQWRGPDSRPNDDAIYFPETGHWVSFGFLDYWQSNGGLLTFGYPLSEEFLEPSLYDGVERPVQYFERGRMEWHAEHEGTQYQVQLGHLGLEALDDRPVPQLAITPQENGGAESAAGPIGPQPLYEPRTVPCGFNFFWWGDDANQHRNEQFLDMLRDSGCEWVRMQFAWSSIEPRPNEPLEWTLHPFHRVVDQAAARGLKVLVNISHAPDWARTSDPGVPADPAAFASFMNRMAAAFAGKVAAWQVWNEPNLVDETNGLIDPEGFFELAKAAAPAIRSADPNALIVFPGLAPNSLMFNDLAVDDDWYLEALFEFENGAIADYFDVFTAHAYGTGNTPDEYYPGNLSDQPGWTNAPEFYYRHIEDIHRILINVGAGDKPIWITEMGWTTESTSENYGYGKWITEDLQAEYLVRAFEIAQTEWPWVENVFIWHLNAAAYAGLENPFSGFSVTDAGGFPRPAYHYIRNLMLTWEAQYGEAH